MTRPLSLLDGRYSYEWTRLLRRRDAGPIQERLIRLKSRESHLCACGLTQDYCVSCRTWFCEAPGHLKHVCAGAA